MRADSPYSGSPYDLRPRAVMEMLDATFRIYRENFIAYITIAASVIIPVTIVTIIQNAAFNTFDSRTFSRTQGADGIAQACFLAIIGIVLSVIQVTVINGVFTKMASERHFGRILGASEAWSEAAPRLGSLAGTYILFYIVVALAFVATSFIGALCFPLFALFGVIAYIAITSGTLLAPVVVLEKIGGGAAFTRAHMIAKTRFWQLIGLGLLAFLLTFVISLAFSALLLPILVSTPSGILSTEGQIMNGVITAIINILTAPIFPIAATLLYYDARVRGEGLDLSLQALGPDARPGDVPPSDGSQALLDSKDYVNILVIVGATVLAALVFGSALYTLINTLVPGLESLPR